MVNPSQERRLRAEAKTAISARLSGRPKLSLEDIVDSSVSGDKHRAARELLQQLAELLQVDPATLRPDDVIGDLLSVTRSDLPEPVLPLWDASGVGNRLEVLGYEILHLVEKASDKKLWQNQWSTLTPKPQNEEQWLDRIAAMKVSEFLTFFTETMLARG